METKFEEYFIQTKPRVDVSRQRTFHMNLRFRMYKYCYSNIGSIYANCLMRFHEPFLQKGNEKSNEQIRRFHRNVGIASDTHISLAKAQTEIKLLNQFKSSQGV